MICLIAMQISIPTQWDAWSPSERAILTEAAKPYARCVNAEVPDYLSLTRPDAKSEAEIKARTDKVSKAMNACRNERAEAEASAASRLPADLETIPSNERRHSIGLFFDRVEDSYMQPIMLGSEPHLLVDPALKGTNR